jgi:hypothetical protein
MSRTSSPPATLSRSVPDSLAALRDLTAAGDLAAARRETRRLLADADPHALTVLAHCADALLRAPDAAVIELRKLWWATDPDHRAIIEACVPAEGQRPALPGPVIDHFARNRPRYVAPRDLRITRRRPSPPRPRGGDSAVTAAYLRERGGVDDQPEPQQRPAGYQLDYDLAAVPALRGLPCVYCWIERSRADHVGDDDGLCGDCRDSGRPGIPALPAGHTRAQARVARCQHIAQTTGAGARAMLTREWKRADRADRAAMKAWAAENPAALAHSGAGN